MAVAAAQKPTDEDLKVPKEPEAEEEDDDDDEVAKLQAIQEEQNAQWQQYVARRNQCIYAHCPRCKNKATGCH